MSELKATPGPWLLGQSAVYADVNGDKVALPLFLGPDRVNEEIANSYLIAAAPELYEALAEAVKTIDHLNDALAETNTWPDRKWDTVDNTNLERKALLAKARGEA
jgi:hypothetical protein